MQTTGWLRSGRDSRLRWLATGVWLAVVATLVVSVVIWASKGGPWQTIDLRLGPPSLFAITLTGVVFGSVGAFVARRAPRNAIGWLFLTIAVGMAALMPVNLMLEASVHAFRPVPSVQLWLAWALTSVQLPFSGAAIIAAVLLFPTGRTDWRFTRPTLITALAGASLLSVSAGLRAAGLLWYATLPNPAAAPVEWRPLLTMISVAGLVALIAALAAAASSLLWRYRYGDARQRRPLAWVMAGCMAMASAVAVLFAARYVGDTTDQSADLLLLIGAIGAAMLPLSMVRFTAITESHGRQVDDVTFVFTDLQDSTGMYERVGDVEAFDLVRLHFRVLEEATSGHHGAIVKTIGDAIMARFEEPREAVLTGLEMHRRLERFNQRSGSGLVLKVGVHRGPAIGVSSRGRVDYFGQAVNVAARVGAIAGAGELVLTEQVYQSPGVADLLAEYQGQLETVQLKGVAEPVSVYRFTGAPGTSDVAGGEPAQAHRSYHASGPGA